MKPISTPTDEYWLEISEATAENYSALEARAERIDGIEEYNFDGDVAYFEATTSGFKDLVYGRIQTEHGEQPVRTLFGRQHMKTDEFEAVKHELEEPVELAADGGSEQEPYNEGTMADVDHEHPRADEDYDPRQESFQ